MESPTTERRPTERRPTERRPLGRVVLILVVASAILGVAIYQGRAIIGRAYRAFDVKSDGPVLEPVEGARFLRSYAMKFNGIETRFGHYVAEIPAEEVIRAYTDRARTEEADVAPRGDLPALTSDGSGCSVFSYVTRSKQAVGIVAFDNPETGGCEYFVGATPVEAPKPDRTGDCPGREPPGVPRPIRSTRTLCIENLGGVASVMTFYEAWGRPSDIVDDLREGMTENGWTERSASSRTLTENYDGDALLSFSREHEQCVVGVDRDSRTGKMVVLIFWADRPWLPKGVAL